MIYDNRRSRARVWGKTALEWLTNTSAVPDGNGNGWGGGGGDNDKIEATKEDGGATLGWGYEKRWGTKSGGKYAERKQ